MYQCSITTFKFDPGVLPNLIGPLKLNLITVVVGMFIAFLTGVTVFTVVGGLYTVELHHKVQLDYQLSQLHYTTSIKMFKDYIN